MTTDLQKSYVLFDSQKFSDKLLSSIVYAFILWGPVTHLHNTDTGLCIVNKLALHLQHHLATHYIFA